MKVIMEREKKGWTKGMPRRPAPKRKTEPWDKPPPKGGISVMLANWVVGCDCQPEALTAQLEKCNWTCVIVVLDKGKGTKPPSELLDILNVLDERSSLIKKHHVTSSQTAVAGWVGRIDREKAVMKITDNIFAVVHKAKVNSVHVKRFHVSAENSDGKRFSTLTLTLDTTRQALEELVIGVADLSGATHEKEVEECVRWIVMEKIAVLTGYFPTKRKYVEYIALNANAVFSRPLFQGVDMEVQDGPRRICPNYFMFFSFYRRVRLCDPFPVAPTDFKFPDQDEWISADELPQWEYTEKGSAHVPFLGNLSTKTFKWEKDWTNNIFQTCVWVGVSVPSRSSQATQREWMPMAVTTRTRQNDERKTEQYFDRSRGRGKKRDHRSRG